MIKDPKVKDPNSKIKEFIQMIKIKNSKLRYLNVHESKIKKKSEKKTKYNIYRDAFSPLPNSSLYQYSVFLYPVELLKASAGVPAGRNVYTPVLSGVRGIMGAPYL